MDTFWFYLNLGFNHVTDWNGLDHFYFLIALSLPFQFKDWKKLLFWVSLFTLGHSVSLIGGLMKFLIFIFDLFIAYIKKHHKIQSYDCSY